MNALAAAIAAQLSTLSLPKPGDVSAWGQCLIGLCVALSAGIAGVRRPWRRTKVVRQKEVDQVAQLHALVAVRQVEAVADAKHAELVGALERQVAARDGQIEALMAINKGNGELHAAALEQLHADRARDRRDLADLREDVAEVRLEKEKLELELGELRDAFRAVEETHRAQLQAKDNRYRGLARRFEELGGRFTVSDTLNTQ